MKNLIIALEEKVKEAMVMSDNKLSLSDCEEQLRSLGFKSS
jgi:hypothetical protein